MTIQLLCFYIGYSRRYAYKKRLRVITRGGFFMYGYGYGGGCCSYGGYGYGGGCGGGYGRTFALIVVLFILLIIVGAAYLGC